MRPDNAEYLSKSTVGLLSLKKSPNKYTVSQVKQDDYSFLQRSVHIPARKQWNVTSYQQTKKHPQDLKSLIRSFDSRTNNKFQQTYSKSSVYDNEPHSATLYSKPQYNVKSNSPTSYQLSSSISYDRNYKNEQFNPNYSNKYDKTVKSSLGDKKVDIDEKYKFYADAVQKFKQQVQITTKMSEQLKKLKEERKKRLQAKQKEKQKQIELYKSIHQLKQKQKEIEINNLSKQLKQKQRQKQRQRQRQKQRQKQRQRQRQRQKEKQRQRQRQKQKQIFKKKSAYEYYSPKQQSTYNFDKYTNDTKLNLKLQKYKSNTVKSQNEGSGKNQLKRKISGNYEQYISEVKTTPFTTASSSLASTTINQLKSKPDNSSIFNGVVKDFILGKMLGQGKFGTVYQAFNKNSRSIYALKKIPKQMIKSHLMVEQFCLQIKLQMFLNHPNILSLFNFFDDKTHIYLVLEYMEQGTLFTHLKKNKKLPQAQVAIKVKQIASAVQYLHENQIAHRDIKPQNIVMSHGVCKLCDFGWATVCDERRKTYCGTFDYAPPEILAGAQYDYTVDLWCLGVLTYQLLVGKAPFYHISRKQTMKKILNVQKTVLEYPEGISKTAISFIDNLIKKDPKDRISSDQILQHPFLKNANTKTDLKKNF